MGVFHFMGLGRSPGVVTAAVSYLADRYERWNEKDAEFFATSGEYRQPGKRGDIQALVLFTTAEVIDGGETGLCRDYVINTPGEIHGVPKKSGEQMKAVLRRYLPEHLRRVAGGRPEVRLYWCEIDRKDPHITFERVARVMHAAKPPGEVGKEVWINLTGGSNVLNLALQLAAALLGGPARLYYLMSDDDRCLYHTTRKDDLGTERDRFWVDIPVVYLQLDKRAHAILTMLERQKDPVDDECLLSRLKSSFWSEFNEMDLTQLRRDYLLPMAGQQLVSRKNEHTITVGQQWAVLRRYYQVIEDLRSSGSEAERNLGALVRNKWFHEDVITLL